MHIGYYDSKFVFPIIDKANTMEYGWMDFSILDSAHSFGANMWVAVNYVPPNGSLTILLTYLQKKIGGKLTKS